MTLPITVQLISAGNFNSCIHDFTHSVQLVTLTAVSVTLPITVQSSSAGNLNSCDGDFTHYSSVQLVT